LYVPTLKRRTSTHKFSELASVGLSSAMAWTGDIGITPVFESALALGLRQFGLVTQDGFRKFVEAVE
jgi:hypothetical protein